MTDIRNIWRRMDEQHERIMKEMRSLKNRLFRGPRVERQKTMDVSENNEGSSEEKEGNDIVNR